MTNKYWAADETDSVIGSLEEKVTEYYDYLNSSGTLSLWTRMYYMTNASAYGDSTLGTAGEHSEYTKFSVNHIRNLIQHVITMTISQRPAFEPRATNSDTESQAQTILARGLLDYYLREKRLERYIKSAVGHAVTYGEGYVTTTWNATMGEVYAVDPDTDMEAHEGDLDYETFHPVDVIRNQALHSAEESCWYIVRRYENKFDIAAKFPEVEDQITSLSSNFDVRSTIKPINGKNWDEDMIPVYTFFHKRTDALPDGRQILFVDGISLTDGPLPYKDMPIFRISSSELDFTPFGYTASYDLMSLQEMINVLYSTIATNQSSFGVQNIAAPRGANIGVTSLKDGLNFIEFDEKAGPPFPLNFTSTPPEVFTFLNMLERTAETLSGVNSVARGNPEASLKSGAALALVQSMAIQFSQGLQQSYVQLLEDLGTSTINILRDYAHVPRIAMIAGKANRGLMREFSGKDLSQINRVMVDAGNPMARTTAGKVELATMMLQSGLITNADELLQVIQTGNLDPLTQGPTNELLSIRSENENLAEGNSVPVLITDKHMLHIDEHKSVLSDPASRENPLIVETTLNHIQEHLNMLMDPANADTLMVLGQEPLQSSQGIDTASITPPLPEDANAMVQDMQPNMPNMPKPLLPGQEIPENPNK